MRMVSTSVVAVALTYTSEIHCLHTHCQSSLGSASLSAANLFRQCCFSGAMQLQSASEFLCMHAMMAQAVRCKPVNAMVALSHAMSFMGSKYLDCAGQKQSLILAVGGQLIGTTLTELSTDMWTMPLA